MELPEEENTPEKRVDRIFAMMDKVRPLPGGATDHLRAWLEAGNTPGVTSTGPVGSRPLQTSRVLSKFVPTLSL